MGARSRNYGVDVQNAVASPTKSAISLTGGTTNRPAVYDWWVGSSASPADNAVTHYAQRSTAAGTGTAYVPPPLDPADPVSITATVTALSAEPTYTAAKILLHLALNQRATHRVQIDPDAPLRVPASANNGIGFYPVHASFTGNIDYEIHFAD